jgi:flagellar biosynthesis protein FlhF
MKIKKFRSKNIQEGKEKVLSELGPEAVILSTRVIPPAPPDNEEMIELVAAIDIEEQSSPTITKSQDVPERFPHTERKSLDFMELASNIYKELSFIKNYLFELSDKINYKFISSLPPDNAELVKLMVKNGFSSDFSLSIAHQLKEEKYTNFDDLRLEASRLLSNKLYYAQGFKGNLNKRRILFIGPTGSGKTLNLTKIAVLFKFLLNSSVSVVSIDLRKIGGWEHLQMLAAVSNLNFTYCQSSEELPELIETLKSYDFILVDTSGGNPRDESFINEIDEIKNAIEWTDIVLVVPVTHSKLNLSENIKAFSKFSPQYLLLTKLDEVTTIGHIYEILLESTPDFPILYLSTGTDIPNSLEPANPEIIRRYLINYLD